MGYTRTFIELELDSTKHAIDYTKEKLVEQMSVINSTLQEIKDLEDREKDLTKTLVIIDGSKAELTPSNKLRIHGANLAEQLKEGLERDMEGNHGV